MTECGRIFQHHGAFIRGLADFFSGTVGARGSVCLATTRPTGVIKPSPIRHRITSPSDLGQHLPPRSFTTTTTTPTTSSATLARMAWRSSGATNADLIENLWRNGMLKSPAAKEAFLRVDRAHYCPVLATAYQDRPQGIGHAATISAPHMHANAVESLLPFLLPVVAGDDAGLGSGSKHGGGGGVEAGRGQIRGVRGRPRRVLDIGSGSGYLTRVLAELVGEDGVVVGVEHIRELKELGEGNMRKSAEGRALLDSGRVRFRMGDGRRGWTEAASSSSAGLGETEQGGVGGDAPLPAPSTSNSRRQAETKDGDGEADRGGWDAIHVGAAAVTLHPELLSQLRSPGRLFIPVEDEEGGTGNQYIWTVDKDEHGQVTKKRLYGVRYVPLTDAPRG